MYDVSIKLNDGTTCLIQSKNKSALNKILSEIADVLTWSIYNNGTLIETNNGFSIKDEFETKGWY